MSTYIVDNYPEFAMEVIMFYSVVINVSAQDTVLAMWLLTRYREQMSAFINPWFISIWVESSGRSSTAP